jgi:(2R)-sulfolactate sulfo-lyase subunit alpha
MALPRPRSAFLLLDPRDNVLICIQSQSAGSPVTIDGRVHQLAAPIALGHKIARTALAVDDTVRRSGVPIGVMSQCVAVAEHVHSHNLKSSYIPAHDRSAANRNDG